MLDASPINGPALSTRGSKARWKAIIEAAAATFDELGFEQATMQQIAESVGLLKGSIYYYIESKEDLLFAVLADYHENIREVRAVVEDHAGTPLERLAVLIEAHIRANLDSPKKSAVFYRDFRFLSPDRRRLVVEQRDSYERFLRGIIQAGCDEGQIQADVDARLTAKLVLGAMNSGYQWYRERERGGSKPAEIAEAMRRLILGGIALPDALKHAAPAREAQAKAAPAREARPKAATVRRPRAKTGRPAT